MRAPKPPTPPAFCSSCGSELTVDASFCSKCGKAVTPDQPDEPEPDKPQYDIPDWAARGAQYRDVKAQQKLAKAGCLGCFGLTALLVVLTIVVVLVTYEGSEEDVPTLSGPGGTGVIGETMVSPPYALTVTHKPSVAISVGEGSERQEPVGRFVIVSIRVTNVGTGGIDIFTNAKLAIIDEDDRRFEAAAFEVQSAVGGLVVEPIDPGDTYNGVVVFDVPRDASQLQLEVDSSLFARVAFVDLGVFP